MSDEPAIMVSADAVVACLDRVMPAVNAGAADKAIDAVTEALEILEHDFTELANEERCAEWLPRVLNVVVECCAWATHVQPVGTLLDRAVALRLRLIAR